MSKLSFSSLRVRLIFLVLISILPVLALMLYSGIEQRRLAILQTKHHALELAQNASIFQNRLINGAHQVLFTLSQLPQVRQQDKAACSAIFADLLEKFEGYSIVTAATLDGNVFASAPFSTRPVNFADCTFFKRVLKTRNYVISTNLIERISDKATIVIAYPVFDDEKRLKAVLSVEMHMEWLKKFIASVEEPSGMIVKVIDRNGTILMSNHDPEKLAGKSLQGTSVFATILAERKGTVEGIGIDGMPRLYGFASLGRMQADLYISISIPTTVAFAPLRRAMIRIFFLLGLVTLAALMTAWLVGGLFIVQPAKTLLRATKQLAGGDLSSRVGIKPASGEIAQIAHAFDMMADSLQKRDANQRETEIALRDSGERYRLLFDNIFDVVYSIDRELKVLSISPSVERFLGYKPEEIVGRRFMDMNILAPEYLRAVQSDTMRVFAGEHVTTGVYEFIAKDGTRRVGEISGSPLMREGKVESAISVARDITKSKLEEALWESEEKYRILVENAGEAIFITQEGVLRFVNKKTEELSGYTQEEIISKPFKDFIYADDRAFVLDHHVKRQQGIAVPPTYPFRIIHKSGEMKWVELNSAVVDWQGKAATLNFLRDITERKRAEKAHDKLQAQLLQAQKMEAIGVLAGGVAHDFNNLLTTIIGYAELSLMTLRGNSPIYEEMTKILKAGKCAASLTRQLMAFSRKQVIQPEVLDLNETLKETEKMLRRLIEEDIELSMILEPELWKVSADPGQINQVFMNLMINARDAMPEGGTLIFETANVEVGEDYFRDHGMKVQAGPYVRVAVSDTGIGMDKETQSKIFDPFFTTKERGKGTGLGLSTVYGIVKQVGGYVWVYSEPGEGTTFKVYLPKTGGDADVRADKQRKVFAGGIRGSETILIVDDDDALRNLAKRVFDMHGYRVLMAGDGEEALRVSREQDGPIHLVLTDVVMPGMSGKEMAERLKSERAGIRVVYMSGYPDDTITKKGVLIKGTSFIEKPLSPEKLARKVREVLDEAKN